MRRYRSLRAHHVALAWLIIYFPWLPGWPLREWLPETPFALIVDANLAGQYALIAFSLVILTGWVGQISLGQGAFVGIGAFTTGLLARQWGVPFPVSLLLVGPLTAAVAALLGMVALRVRGLYLAVATLIFAWIADAYLFSASWFVGSGGSSAIPNRVLGVPNSITIFDLSNKRTLYLVMVAAVAAAWYAAVNLRDSKTGRAFFAIRGSELAAVSLGIDVIRYKLLAFALSGGLAGIAGNLIMLDLRVATPPMFQFTVSLFYLGIAVVGGISSLGGAVATGMLFAGLTEVFFRVDFLEGWLDIVTIGLLLAVLLLYPQGLAGLGQRLKERATGVRSRVLELVAYARQRLTGLGRTSSEDETADADVPGVLTTDADTSETPNGSRSGSLLQWLPFGRLVRGALPRRSINLAEVVPHAGRPAVNETDSDHLPDWRTMDLGRFSLPRSRTHRAPVLEAEGITVRFGGLVAADSVSLSVKEHEIVGLIGPNGAGKTTTFNAIAGINQPSEGSIRLFGHDVTNHPVHLRAQMGMGRTFQLIQLFSQLTVIDNLLVASHVQNETGVFSHMGLTRKAIIAELDARERVKLVVDLLGLHDVAHRKVAGLPFGILRQVEIARALVTESPLLMLDEPASGLDNAETDELAQLLYYLRAQLGISILLIEHDVRMVTGVSDYMYVLNQGRLLAEGTPVEIQRNPVVIAAYLGQPSTDTAASALAPA